MSLSAWKSAWEILQELQSTQAPPILLPHRFHQHFKVPTAPLSVYLKPLQSSSRFIFISHLRIAGSCLVKSTELMQLPGLVKNLGVLEIIEPSDSALAFPWLSDRLIKAWSLQEDPFPQLKVLTMHTNASLTEKCLRYVTQFPALASMEVLGAKQDWRNAEALARDHGWIPCRWTRAPSLRIEPGHTSHPTDTSLASPASWLSLAQRIGAKSSSTRAQSGAAGYEIYAELEQPLPAALLGDLPVDEPRLPSRPFVSLMLGQGQGWDGAAIGASYSTPPAMETFFFWRYWELGGGDPAALAAQFAPAENAVRKPVPPEVVVQGMSQGEGERKRGRGNGEMQKEPGSGLMRPRKRNKTVNVGDALSQFQGK